jgi:hypothetical protein
MGPWSCCWKDKVWSLILYVQIGIGISDHTWATEHTLDLVSCSACEGNLRATGIGSCLSETFETLIFLLKQNSCLHWGPKLWKSLFLGLSQGSYIQDTNPLLSVWDGARKRMSHSFTVNLQTYCSQIHFCVPYCIWSLLNFFSYSWTVE